MKELTEENPPIIIVRVGEREFRTGIDLEGDQRFLYHHRVNPEITELMRPRLHKVKTGELPEPEVNDPNYVMYTSGDLLRDYHFGRWTTEEMVDYVTNLRCTIQELRSFSIFSNLEIENPYIA